MQGLADGYFVLPYTIQNYLSADIRTPRMNVDSPEFVQAEKDVRSRIDRLMSIKGKKSVDSFHKRLGHAMWENVGMGRTKESLTKAIELIRTIREEFWTDVHVTGSDNELNPELEKALRVADFLELGELMAKDALLREESCGGHFREEFQTEEGEAKRNDEQYMYVAAWEYKGEGQEPVLNKEPLLYENIKVAQRNYK
jgi:succinate dehydrogenase / fumarate reductase flavoprotein subunit